MTLVHLSLPLKDAELLLSALDFVARCETIGCYTCGTERMLGVSEDDFPPEEVEHLIAALRISVEAARC